MRKIVFGGAAAAILVGLLAFGGRHYAQTRALALVEERFAALRASGITAVHGPVTFDVFERNLQIAGVELKTKGEPAVDARIGAIYIKGVDVWASDLVAKHIEMTQIEAKGAFGRDGVWRGEQRIPRLIADDVRVARQSADLAEAKTDWQRWAAQFAMLTASTITAPELKVNLTMPTVVVPAAGQSRTGEPMKVEYAYEGLQLENVRDGRAARVAAAAMTMRGDAASVGTGRIGGLTVADVDLMPYFGLGLQRRKATDGYYPVTGQGSAGPYLASLPGGVEMRIEGMTFGAAGIDPQRADFARFYDSLTKLTALGPNPPPAKAVEALTGMLDIYGAISFEGAELRNMKMSGGPQGLSFGTLRMGAMKAGRLDDFRLLDMKIDNRTGPRTTNTIGIGVMAIKGLDFSKMMKVAMALPQPGSGAPAPSPQQIAKLLTAFEGFELGGIDVPTGTAKPSYRVDALELRWGNIVNDIPASSQWRYKGQVPVQPGDPLARLGLRALDLVNDGSIDWQERDSRIVGKFALASEQLGLLATDLRLDNVPRSAVSLEPAKLASLLEIAALGPIGIELKDRGLVAIFTRELRDAGPPAAQPNSAQASPLAMLREQILDPARPDPAVADLLDKVEAFLRQPGQTLALRLTPKTKVTLANMLAGATQPGPVGLAQLLDQFRIEARVSR